MDSMFLAFLSQLAAQSPVLLAYLVGAVLSLVFWGRYPGPAMLTFFACLLLLLVNLGQTFLIQYFIHLPDVRAADRAWVFTISALISSVLRAAGFGMLLTAVFIGRGPRQRIS